MGNSQDTIAEIRRMITRARKNGNRSTIAILSVLLGEIQSLQMLQWFPITKKQILGIIKKLKGENEECMGFLEEETNSERYRRLLFENLILDTFLPQPLTLDEIEEALKKSGQLSKILAQRREEQAVAIAIKLLNSGPGFVDQGGDVALVVKKLRCQKTG